MTNKQRRKTVIVHCNACGQATDHDVLHEEKREYSEEVEPGITFEAHDWYRLLSCAGCKAVTMEHVSANSEDWEPDTGPNYSKEYFPPRTFRRVPRWLEQEKVPTYVRRLLTEIYVAVQNGAPSLAGMGIRALLESLMIEKIGDQGTFAANLKAFAIAGHVSRGQLELLESTLEVGHAVMHRRFVPGDEALIACLDATEHVVQSIYVFPTQSVSLRKAVPKRKARGKSKSKGRP